MRATNELSLNLPFEKNDPAAGKYDFGLPVVVAFGLMTAAFVVAKLLDLFDSNTVTVLNDSFQLAAICLAVLMTLQVVRHPSLTPEARRPWRNIVLAFLAYTVGNLFWFYYSSVLGEKPFPTIADGAYLAFYPLMLWALLSFPTAKDNRPERLKFILDVAIVMLGGSMVVWYFIIQPILEKSVENDWLMVALNLVYTVADLILMLGIATTLFRQVEENSRQSLWLIVAGLVFQSIADYGYAYTTLQNTYYSGHWVDVFYQLSIFSFIIASHYQYRQLSKPAKPETDDAPPVHRFSWLPYLAVALGCGILLKASQPFWSEPIGTVIFAAIGITVLVVVRQVTAVRENLRLQAEQAARRSEIRFKTLVENSTDMITIRNSAGEVAFRSPSVGRILGYTEEELGALKSNELIHPDDVELLNKSYDLLASGAADVFRCEYRAKHKNGSWLVFEGCATDYEDEVVGKHAILINSRDVTERRAAENKLRAFTAQLQQSNRELQDFAYVASHDLQEPLRKVQAFGDRLQRKYGETLGDEGRDYVKRMRDAAGRMQVLINDLLTFSRVTTKAQPFRSVDLRKIADEVVSDLEVRIEQTGGRVEIAELPTIDADAMQMRQLLQNLIGNALKFYKPGEKPLVKVYAEAIEAQSEIVIKGEAIPVSAFCRLVVEDNGIGFDEKYLDRIFTVFQRLHGRSEYEGSGIGLAVCRKIVERHGGKITAHSAPDAGARFYIDLPVAQEKESNEKQP